MYLGVDLQTDFMSSLLKLKTLYSWIEERKYCQGQDNCYDMLSYPYFINNIVVSKVLAEVLRILIFRKVLALWMMF